MEDEEELIMLTLKTKEESLSKKIGKNNKNKMKNKLLFFLFIF